MCIAIALVSRQTTRSLRSLSKSTEEIAQGNLDTELTKIPGAMKSGVFHVHSGACAIH